MIKLLKNWFCKASKPPFEVGDRVSYEWGFSYEKGEITETYNAGTLIFIKSDFGRERRLCRGDYSYRSMMKLDRPVKEETVNED